MVAGRLQEKNDYFYIVLSYKDENGKRKEPWFKTGLKVRGNKKKAEDMLNEYRESFDIKTGQLKSPTLNLEISTLSNPKSEILFGDYLLQWLERIKNTIEMTTYSGYKCNIKQIIAPYFNERGISLSMLSGEIIDEFYNYQIDRGVTANTVIHYHANIRKALDDAFKDGLIPYNFADKAHRPKKEDFIANYYNRDELLELFKAAKGKKIEFAVLMASYYGLRRSEIMGLKWSCVDFKEKKITIKHTVTEFSLDGKLIRVAKDRAKTKKSIRSLPLVEPVEKLLLKIKKKEEYNKEFFGTDYNYDYDEYIYKDANGELVKPGYITQAFKEQLIDQHTELRRIRFHDLRHSCATLLRSEGVPLGDIQKWLGHSEITTTEKLYAHFDYKNHLKSAMKITNAFEIEAE